MLYKFISISLWFVRQFVLPNPFDVLGEGLTVTINGASLLLSPAVLNGAMGWIIPAVTGLVVGIYYSKGSCPVAGSCLFMIFYMVHSGLVKLMCLAYPHYWLISLILIAYIAGHIGINKWLLNDW